MSLREPGPTDRPDHPDPGVAVSHLFEGVLRLPPALALPLVFLLPALEASAFVGVVIPGEIGVLLGGVLANQGKLPLWAVLAAGIAGAVIGDSIGYAVGERYGERLLTRLPRRLVKPEHVKRTEQTIEQLGGKAVFVGRFTAALRALVPGIAGMSGMTYRTFLPWNLLGGACWAAGFVVLGYLAGSQYQRIEHDANDVGLGLLAAIVLFLVVRHRRSRSGAAKGDA
jgi:undecaprenyl-diphosphatase